MRRVSTHGVWALLACIILSGSAWASSQNVFSLFEDTHEAVVAADKSMAAGERGLSERAFPARRQRSAGLSRSVVRQGHLKKNDRLQLNLFDNARYTAAVDRLFTNINGSYAVRGRIEGSSLGYVLLATTGDESRGVIVLPEENRTFMIEFDGANHIVYEVDPDQQEPVVFAPPVIPDDEEPLSEINQMPSGPMNTPLPTDPAMIDVMVVYTEATQNWAGSFYAVSNLIALAMEQSQLVLDNSQTHLTLNLVHSGQVDYHYNQDESLTDYRGKTVLARLQNPNDGYMDIVHTWRDQYQADMVVLITPIADFSGVAYLLTSLNGRPSLAFSVIRPGSAVGSNYVVAHEMGHNWGAHHHKHQGTEPGPTPWENWPENTWSAGWRWRGSDNKNYVSIMSYFQYTETITVPYFSNPNIQYAGAAAGHPADGDNARTIRQTKHIVANYRAGQNSTRTIAGYLYRHGQPLSNITVRRTGNGVLTSVTDANGRYEFVLPNGWSGTVTPQITEPLNFCIPAERFYSSLTVNHLHDNYDITLAPRTISGSVRNAQNVGIGDVRVSADNYGGSAMTDSNGGYTLTVYHGWSGQLTAQKNLYTFSPEAISLTHVTADLTGCDFTASLVTYTVSGQIRREDNSPLGQVAISATGGLTAVTDGSGYYSLIVPPNWHGDVTPSCPGYLFEPEQNYVSQVKADVTGKNFVAVAGFALGSGTDEDPYIIQTVSDWLKLQNYPTLGYKSYALANDLDFQGISMKPIQRFAGSLNGNRYTLHNVTILKPNDEKVGLVSTLSSPESNHSPTIRNLNLRNVNISGDTEVGGLVGRSMGNIINCSVTGSVTGKNRVGGLVGNNYTQTISQSFADCTVSGQSRVGGLVGYNDAAIVRSYARGTILKNNSEYLTNAGGLVGYQYVEGTIDQSYAAVDLKVAQYSYNDIGGLIGYSTRTIAPGSFWDQTVSGQAVSAGGTGKTTAQLQTPDTFIDAGWDAEDVWKLQAGAYPEFFWETAGPILILDGQGTPGDPYKIRTVADWQRVMNAPTVWNKHFILMADLDMQGIAMTPLGSADDPFTGSLDGNGRTVVNVVMTFPSQDNIGLFGSVASEGRVENLSVANGQFAGRANVGALVGHLAGTLINCHSTGTLSATAPNSRIGGLVGYNQNGFISFSSANAVVTGKDNVGGLVGYTFNNATIISSFARGTVHGENAVGGLVGKNSISSVSAAHSHAAVNGTAANVGGLIGYNGGQVSYCYSVGAVGGTTNAIGGLIGANIGTVSSSFWDKQTSGQSASAGGTGLLTFFMKTEWTFQNAGWNFVDTWKMPIDDAPRLKWQKGYSGGSGTAQTPYWIRTLADWVELTESPQDYDKHFRLYADLDLQACDSPVVAQDTDNTVAGFQGVKFNGAFDGNGKTIRNLSIASDAGYVGLFGAVGPGGHIHDLRLDNALVSGRANVGMLAGRNEGAIRRCRVQGNATGTIAVGGLVGDNAGLIEESGCVASVVIGSSFYAGGLVGWNSGHITNAYSIAEVSGNYHVGGLVGYASGWFSGGTIANSYAASSVAALQSAGGLISFNDATTVSDCFWDMDISGQTASDGGMGQSTAQMRYGADYRAAGWDFAPTAADGDPAVWYMTHNGYPRLRWEEPVGMNELLILASNWLMDGCDSTQPCADADWHADGAINLYDFADLARSWKGGEMYVSWPDIRDGFESGDFSALPWQHNTANPWTIIAGKPYEGTYLAMSGNSSRTASVLTLTLDTTGRDTMQFAATVSAETFESLTFAINGATQQTWTGSQNWQVYTYPITPGVNTFVWTWSSNNITNPGNAAIDNIKIYRNE